MTPEERAQELVDVLVKAFNPGPAIKLFDFRDAIAAAIREAVLEEREECAKAAEQEAVSFLSSEYATGQPLSSTAERFACKQVAAAIRSRS